MSDRIVFNLLLPKYTFTEDKNDLMRERMRQEKAKTNGDKETEAQQKRKHPSSEEKTGGQKKKKKPQKQTESVKEKEQKAKDREEKQKKKAQDHERQRFLLEARKAQAASRWAANDNVNNHASTTFTPEPIRQADSTPSCQLSTPLTPANSTLSTVRTPNTATPKSTPQESLPANTTLPARPNILTKTTAGSKSKGICEPRRGLHFQSAVADSSDDEIDEEVEIISEESENDVSGTDCCKEQRLETKALRKRLEKVHKRLNIACKFLCL